MMCTLSTVMTFSADSKPLAQVVHLWDYMLAAGVHVNTFCVTARLMLVRSDILNNHNLSKYLGKDLPPLSDAASIIALASQLYLKSSAEFISKCRKHMKNDKKRSEKTIERAAAAVAATSNNSNSASPQQTHEKS
eukprot:TRINITY_DN2901_c0_g1_i1.p1 TRINITY_DN2901_c0_g1~~TRINITY_DN2901_c0_g1_i1.p1  ORF type:complete len:135 (-),score=16.58 TRINITY_DN2901_c0_g1_i1:5-409(-)